MRFRRSVLGFGLRLDRFDLFGGFGLLLLIAGEQADDLLERPETVISRVESFLGVDLFMPRNLDVQYNSSWQFQTPLQKIAQRIPGGQIIPRHWKHWFWWILERRKPKLKEEKR